MKIHRVHRSSKAFTVVELTIAIVIIGILATLATLGTLAVQKNSRDAQRSTSTTILAKALEKYYEQHGEYPSCEILQSDPQATLPGIDSAALSTKKCR